MFSTNTARCTYESPNFSLLRDADMSHYKPTAIEQGYAVNPWK
jgi:hypothetical protein